MAFVDGGGRGLVSPDKAVEVGLGASVVGFVSEEFLPLLVALLLGVGGVAFTSGAFVEGLETVGVEGLLTVGLEGFETVGDLLGVAAGVGLEVGLETLGDLLGVAAGVGFDFGAEGLLTVGLREGVLLGVEGLEAGREEGLEEDPPPRLERCAYASLESEQTIKHESKTTNHFPKPFFVVVIGPPLAFV